MRSVLELIKKIEDGMEPDFLFFWGHTESGDGVTAACLSQWYPKGFEVDGVIYKTAEHWMMAEKARIFEDEAAREAIIQSDDPNAAKALGRKVSPFDPKVWDAQKFDVVLKGSVHKFGQDDELKSFLLSTGERILVEASPRDKIWGIGMGKTNPDAQDPALWRGENLLGFALMEARTILRETE